MELDEIRKEIDDLDYALINIIAKRLSLMPEIAQIKKEQGLLALDAKREVHLLAERMQVARKKGLDPQMVEKIFKILLKTSRLIQEELMI